MRVTVKLGRRFAAEAGSEEFPLDLPKGSTAASLLAAIASRAPKLSCLDAAGTTVDLSVANLSVNGRAVDPRNPSALALAEGDSCYLYGIIGGG